MESLHILIPILTGAVIGYFTNYIAIRMLFHPRREMHIGRWRVPFTPGVIPKNQMRLARAVGNAVSGKLLTGKDLSEQLTSGPVRAHFISEVSDMICGSDLRLSDLHLSEPSVDDELSGEEGIAKKIGDYLGDKIVDDIRDMDLNPVVRGFLQEVLGDFLQNPMIAMFVSDNMLSGIYDKISDGIKKYMDQNGREIISSYAQQKINEIMEKPVSENLAELSVHKDMVRAFVGVLFDSFVDRCGTSVVEQLDISKMVQDKIAAMDVKELEDLVMSVMKQELQTVINLGALIGAVIGIVNIFY